ncbi:MAG: hypothetical protein ACRDH2_01255, partial [Anaerolineales bacterium]
RWGRAAQAGLLASNVLTVGLIMLFKLKTTIRIGGQTSFVSYMDWIARRALSLNYDQYDYGFNLKQALAVNYGDYGLGLPWAVLNLLRAYPDVTILLLATLLGLTTFSYLVYTLRQEREAWPSRSVWLWVAALGLVVFGLGYTIFLTNYNVQFTPTGIANRTTMAAAIGVTLSLVGALGWVSTLLPARFHQRIFSALIALVCLGSVIVNNTLAAFWVKASEQEQTILADIHERFPTLPTGSTLLLDGVCPYLGPAIVFESSWDLAGALLIHYHDYSLRADVVTPRLQIKPEGLTTSLYDVEYTYPYENLLVYHAGQRLAFPLSDAEAARRYFEQYDPNFGGDCLPGHEGHGVPILD